MILTITPNPMLDKTIWLSHFEKGQVHRSERIKQVAGGKGLNVSCALVGLNEATVATGFLGGWTGQVIRRLLDEQTIPHHFIETAATTREGFTFVDEASGERTAVFEPGSQLLAREVDALKQFVQEQLPNCRGLALCGSMPCAGFDNLYADLIKMARAANVPVFLDSYLEPLKMGLAAGPQFLKPNREEALNTFGIDMRTSEGAQSLLQLLAHSGAQCIFLTDAQHPVRVRYHKVDYVLTPPEIDCTNPLGGGDVLVAAFLYGWLHEMEDEELLRFAVAAGTVNAMHEMPGYAEIEEINDMMKRVELERGLPLAGDKSKNRITR